MPNDDEWDAFNDSSEEEKPVKKEAAKPVAAPSKGDDDSSDGGWEDEADSDGGGKEAPKPEVKKSDGGGDGGSDDAEKGWEDASDDDEKDKEFQDEDGDGRSDRNKDLAKKPDANWDDESDHGGSDKEDGKPKAPLTREENAARNAYGKRLKEQKRKAYVEKQKQQKIDRAKKKAERALADPGAKDRYTEDNALLFGADQKQTGWQDLEITFTKRPLGFSIDPSKRVRKISEKSKLMDKGLTKGAIVVGLDRADVTKVDKEGILQRLKTAVFPLKITFYNPPYNDALLSKEDGLRLNRIKVEKKGPVKGARISLKDYPLGCPGDFKKFGKLIGTMVRKSRFNDKGTCIMPFLKEVLSLSLQSLEADEIGQAQSHINSIWQLANRKRRGGQKKSKFNIKEEVESNYQDTGEWYRATVVEVLKGLKYKVKYPDYENELEIVPEVRLRVKKKKMDKYKREYEDDDFDFLDD